jgi:pilus assembly protein FimV
VDEETLELTDVVDEGDDALVPDDVASDDDGDDDALVLDDVLEEPVAEVPEDVAASETDEPLILDDVAEPQAEPEATSDPEQNISDASGETDGIDLDDIDVDALLAESQDEDLAVSDEDVAELDALLDDIDEGDAESPADEEPAIELDELLDEGLAETPAEDAVPEESVEEPETEAEAVAADESADDETADPLEAFVQDAVEEGEPDADTEFGADGLADIPEESEDDDMDALLADVDVDVSDIITGDETEIADDAAVLLDEDDLDLDAGMDVSDDVDMDALLGDVQSEDGGLNDLVSRMDALEDRFASLAGEPDAQTDLEKRIEAMEARMDEVEDLVRREVERLVPAEAARIIREEIAALARELDS